ncbi:MAG: hypothetical protein HY866_12065 [Chloroflexi bacterium]|nr:hypothetical protein [Chloroflexota bacterium]
MMVPETSVLLDIHPGMEVYDLDNNKIGIVKYVKLPEGYILDVDTMGDDTLRNVVAALTTAAHIPVETREQILQSGFVRLDTGLLHADRYITPDQIRDVFTERIRLRVTRDELL